MGRAPGKAEFIQRVARRARTRYGKDFTETTFNDLLKDHLLPPASRGENKGKRPVYLYDCRTYRRALQVVRLQAKGVIDRDAIRIQLFLHWCDLPLNHLKSSL